MASVTMRVLLSVNHYQTTFHVRELAFADAFANNISYLTNEGLIDYSEMSVTDHRKNCLATAAFRDLHYLDWSGSTVYALVEPHILDQENDNLFHRTLRVVLNRLNAELYYPYDQLDTVDARAAWMTACIEDGEIRPTHHSWRKSVRGVNLQQRPLGYYVGSDIMTYW